MHKHIYSHIRGLKPMLGLFDSTHITYNDECINLILWNKSLVSITTTEKPQQKASCRLAGHDWTTDQP